MPSVNSYAFNSIIVLVGVLQLFFAIPCQASLVSDDKDLNNEKFRPPTRRSDFIISAEPTYTCGVYSIFGALKALGFQPDIDEMLDEKYMEWGSGSSVKDLLTLAKDNGAYAQAYHGVGIQWLKRSSDPVILHMGRSRRGNEIRHWVLFLGDENGMARIYDSPRSIQLINYSDLLAAWDGIGLVVSKEPKSQLLAWIVARSDLALWLFFPFLFSAAIRLYWPRNKFAVKHNGKLRQCVLQSTCLLTIGGAAAALFHSVAPTGFVNNHNAIYSVQRPFLKSETFEEVDYAQLVAEIEDECILIDARSELIFHRESLPGAVSVPIDSTHQEFEDAISQLDPKVLCVVFCSHEFCEWASIVGTDLKHAGFDKIKVFKGGLREWRSRQIRH